VIDLVDRDVHREAEPVGTFWGRNGLLSFWRDWAGLWETYVYEVREVEDHGRCALTVAHVEARGRDGIEVEVSTFQVWEVRDGKIVWQRTCLTREDAREALAERCG